MSFSYEYYQEIEESINAIIDCFSSRLEKSKFATVSDYSRLHGEYGLAIMDLIDFIIEGSVQIHQSEFDDIVNVSSYMKLEDKYLQRNLLIQLVKEKL